MRGMLKRALHLQACFDGVKGVWVDGHGTSPSSAPNLNAQVTSRDTMDDAAPASKLCVTGTSAMHARSTRMPPSMVALLPMAAPSI